VENTGEQAQAYPVCATEHPSRECLKPRQKQLEILSFFFDKNIRSTSQKRHENTKCITNRLQKPRCRLGDYTAFLNLQKLKTSSGRAGRYRRSKALRRSI
jgi:hypothetical protein